MQSHGAAQARPAAGNENIFGFQEVWLEQFSTS
jgi:hypothetical protein